jgi:hypothetical protein
MNFPLMRSDGVLSDINCFTGHRFCNRCSISKDSFWHQYIHAPFDLNSDNLMVFRQGLSKGDATRKCGYAIALLTAAIGGIFNSSGYLFPAFGVASSIYINETKVQQPLANLN